MPLRIFATHPTADTKLNIGKNLVELGDGAGQSSGPGDDLINSFVDTTIDMQDGSVTGGTVKLLGGTFSLPAGTVGQFRRLVLVYQSELNQLDVNFSAEAASVAALTNPGALFADLDADALVGWVDLECTDVAGKYKTAGSATAIVENKVGSDLRINRFGSGSGAGGKGDTSFKLQSITGSVAKVKKGKYKIANTSFLISGNVTEDKPADINVDLANILTTPAATTLYWLCIDLGQIVTSVAMSDTKQVLYPVYQDSEFKLLTQDYADINKDRYVPIGTVYAVNAAWDASVVVETIAYRPHEPLSSWIAYVDYKNDTHSTAGLKTVTHSWGVKPTNIFLEFYDNSSGLTTPLANQNYVTDITDADVDFNFGSLTFDSGDYVAIRLEYAPQIANALAVQTRRYESPWWAASPGASVAHGLSDKYDIASYVVLRRDKSTGDLSHEQGSNPVSRWDDDNIYFNWTPFDFATYDYKVITGSTSIPQLFQPAKKNKYEFTATGQLTTSTTSYPLDLEDEEEIVDIRGLQKIGGNWQPVSLVGVAYVEDVAGVFYLRGDIDSALTPSGTNPVRILVQGKSVIMNGALPADSANSGLMTAVEQSFGGPKYFESRVNFGYSTLDDTDDGYTASKGERIFADTSSAIFTINLPATPSFGDTVEIFDAKASFGSNILTIGRNGEKIQGAENDETMTQSGMMARFVYLDSANGWRVYNG
jgi:hypothetical protein